MRLGAKKIRRIKFDGAYIFATVFAGIGGLILLSTYAASKPVETFHPGSYSLSKYATSKPDVYQLGINGKLNYCLLPLKAAEITSVSLISGNNEQPIILNKATADSICFKTSVNHDKVLVKILPTPTQPVVIRAN